MPLLEEGEELVGEEGLPRLSLLMEEEPAGEEELPRLLNSLPPQKEDGVVHQQEEM